MVLQHGTVGVRPQFEPGALGSVKNLTRRDTGMPPTPLPRCIQLKGMTEPDGPRLAPIYCMNIRRVMAVAVAAIAFVIALCPVAAAQISMQRPGLTGVPQGRKLTAPAIKPQQGLTADEQKRLSAVIKHMSHKQRRKFAKAVQKMTPQQRQQLVASVKQQLAKERPASQPAKRGW